MHLLVALLFIQATVFFYLFSDDFNSWYYVALNDMMTSEYCIGSTCCILRCLVCTVVSCHVCVVVVVLCVLLSSYVYLLYCVCIAVFTLDAGLLASSQYSEGPATGHLDTGFSWFPCA